MSRRHRRAPRPPGGSAAARRRRGGPEAGTVAPAGTIPAVPALPGAAEVIRLGNGLTAGLLDNPQAPLVTTVLWYRAGSRDEPPGHGGLAHFLEHMMFKGSARYGPGEIDRRTQALGGINNAFTDHDGTAYWFSFARDRWREALAIEADRMAGLVLDPEAVASERRVILEEIAMVEADPWDALHLAVEAALFAGHPYGRPVLGTRRELAATGAAELAAFHHARYRPDGAVLVVAGDLDGGRAGAAAAAVEAALGGLPAGAAARPAAPPARFPDRLRRLSRRQGEVGRLMLALPAPPAGHPDHAPLAMLIEILASGRASRLHRALVDDGQLCVWADADLGASLDPGAVVFSFELLPGVAPERAEQALLAELAALAGPGARTPPSEAEVERARRVVVADWVFGHERIHQQALAAAYALAFFDDLEHPQRELARVLEADRETLLEVAARWLRPERGAVLGWSLPREEG